MQNQLDFTSWILTFIDLESRVKAVDANCVPKGWLRLNDLKASNKIFMIDNSVDVFSGGKEFDLQEKSPEKSPTFKSRFVMLQRKNFAALSTASGSKRRPA